MNGNFVMNFPNHTTFLKGYLLLSSLYSTFINISEPVSLFLLVTALSNMDIVLTAFLAANLELSVLISAICHTSLMVVATDLFPMFAFFQYCRSSLEFILGIFTNLLLTESPLLIYLLSLESLIGNISLQYPTLILALNLEKDYLQLTATTMRSVSIFSNNVKLIEHNYTENSFNCLQAPQEDSLGQIESNLRLWYLLFISVRCSEADIMITRSPLNRKQTGKRKQEGC